MERKLMDLGLSKNESKIYLTLIELGSITVKRISDSTGIHRSNIYETLQKMAEKGLVSAVMREGKRYYSSNKPESLFTLLDYKKTILQQILPDLNKLHKKNLQEIEHSVDIYQGSMGLKQILWHMLKIEEPIYAFGIPSKAIDVMKYFIANFHDERIKKKIPIFHLYDEDAIKRIKELNSMPYTEAKVLRGNTKSPATTSVFGNYVTIWVWSDPVFLLLIKSKSMAQSYKQYFDILWSTS